MIGFVPKIKPEFPLRLGLGLMYCYSGQSFIRDPLDWQGFIPAALQNFFQNTVGIQNYLFVQGIGEIAIGLVLLAWFLPRAWIRIVSLLSVIEFAGILVLTGIDLITFRDIGLLGASLALAVIAWRGT